MATMTEPKRLNIHGGEIKLEGLPQDFNRVMLACQRALKEFEETGDPRTPIKVTVHEISENDRWDLQ